MSSGQGSLFDGSTAIVTGGARGIGLAIAQLLAEHGANLVIADIDGNEAARAAAEMNGVAVGGDMTDAEVPQRIVERAIDAFGSIEIVVNNAGYNLNARAETMDDDTWTRMLDVHVTAPFRLLRAAAASMIESAKREQVAGVEVFRKVVNVASIAIMGSVGQANYAAGKAAVVGLTKSLAKEWAPHHINVNAVAFGSIGTRLTQPREAGEVIDVAGRRVRLGLPLSVVDSLHESIPFGRVGTPSEAAGGVFLLCTPWSNWVTGQTLVVSGGQVFGMSS